MKRIKQVECEPLKIVPSCRKKSYRSHGAALAARRLLHRVNHEVKKRRRGSLSVYFCTTCDGWHVGHTPKRRKV